MENLLDILDVIGVIAFAVSGAMTAIEKKMDLLGICVLGIVTSVGGGVIRDVILGITPPRVFTNSRDVLIAAIISCIVFIVTFLKKYKSKKVMILSDNILMISDAIGLGAFTIIGINVAISTLNDYNSFLLVFVGVITGVGGGVLRDIMCGSVPYIFQKHIYAVASAAGAISYVFVYEVIGRNVATVICSLLVISIRFLAAHFQWNLPRIEHNNESINQ